MKPKTKAATQSVPQLEARAHGAALGKAMRKRGSVLKKRAMLSIAGVALGAQCAVSFAAGLLTGK